MQKISSLAWAEVDLDKITRNVRKLKRAAGHSAKVLAMVKAQGYGCGAEMVSRAALDGGAELLGVASVAEAVSLKRCGLECPVLIFGRPADSDLESVVGEGFLQTVFDLPLARQLDSVARKLRKKATVHLKVDTGMGRLGVLPREVEAFLEGLASCQSLVLGGAFTHFAAADNDLEFTQEQLRLFVKALEEIRSCGYQVPIVHVANTAAILGRCCHLFDMVRPGISIYGLYGSAAVSRELNLEEAIAFKARVVHVKRIPPGASVSYGREYVAPRETTVATIAAGYADGVPFHLGGRGHVLIRGRRFPIVGRVTMDMTMVDVGDCAEVTLGDEAVIMGESDSARIAVREVAEIAGTIEHQIMCGIGPRVPRVYLRHGQVVCVHHYTFGELGKA